MKNKASINLKKITSYMLALLMIFSNFAFFPTIKATATPTLTIGSQTAINGASIIVPITGNNFTADADIVGLQFRVNYDNALLSFTGFTAATVGVTTINNVGDYISILWDHSGTLMLDNETFISLAFDVISPSSTSANLDHSNQVVSNSSGNPVTANFVNGVITLNPDATAPVITLLGENPITIQVGAVYNDAGATALDNVDGDISATIATTGLPINTAIPGAYTITYNVSDAAGNPAIQITRTVNVVDVTTPIITLLGENPITIELGAVYTDAGVTASDDVDGDITANIITVNPVNSNIVGVYIITYNVADLSGNPAPEVTRTVNVVDTTAPIITLLGDNPANIEVGYQYSDAGATANDNYDGNITGNIITVNNVNSNVVGTYAVTYNVSDLSGNPAAEVVRTVNVTPDATAPVITLNSGNKSIYQGTIYTDLGAAALDNIDGNITANIIVTGLPLDTTLPGVYTIAYNVLDAAGNKAVEITRTVNVLPVAESQALIQEEMILDTKAPEIMIGDNAPIAANINVSSTIANAQLNFSALVSGDTEKSAIIPSNLTINSDTNAGKVSVQIPQGAQVSCDSSWTGKINLPQAQENSSVNVIPNFGYAAQVSAVIEIGFGDILLNFDKAVRIKIDNQASKYIGYSRSGVFTPITNVCSTDSQTVGDALPTAGDCKIDVGSDLIVWTKHFTKFAVYTQTAIPAPISNGGSVFVAPVFTAPVEGLSIAINGGAKTASSENVVLTLNGGSQAQRMAISNSPDFAGSSQESYATTKNWTLSKGDGNKTVYVKFYNSYGSPSAVVSASIQLSAQLVSAPADVIAKTPAPIQAILGIKTYNDGALLRGSDKRIYLVNNGQLQYIANLKELAKYIRKEILNVKDDVIASYGPAVLGAKEYADNSLIRGSDQKIYIIINRKKKHVASFDDLRKNYFNQVINNVSDSVVNQY